MTTGEIKAALNLYREYVKEIEILRRQSALLEEKATATGSLAVRPDKVVTSLSLAARFENVVADKAEVDRQIAEEIASLDGVRTRVLTLIRYADKRIQRRVLRMRYVDLLSFPEIAKVMDYSQDNVYTIHRKAIRSIAKKI